MNEKCLVTLRLRAGTLTAEVPPEETEDVLAALTRWYGKYWIAYVKDTPADCGAGLTVTAEKKPGKGWSWTVSSSTPRQGGRRR